MAKQALYKPVNDGSVPKVDNAVAVGEDLTFQQRWWTFERVIWSVFLLILMADVLGVFGRGWLSKAEIHEADTGIDVWYERVERANTPSILSIDFQLGAIENGKVNIFVSNSIVKELGNQRIAPQPQSSTIGNDGITYVFPATGTPARISFSLEPSFPGVHRFVLRVPGRHAATGKVTVVP